MTLHRPNTQAADRVMSFLDCILGAPDDVFVERYTNCREQGYALTQSGRKVAFSECRNSDSTQVYFGKQENFAFNTNIPDEPTYKAVVSFKFGDDYKAAVAIEAYLVSGKLPKSRKS